MCGICGIVDARMLDSRDDKLIAAMNESLYHRGPDDSGEFAAANVRFAMRRLSIIDVAGGKQPLHSEDGSIVLVANGEIYNHIELRRELQGMGHHFATKSDCETIVHLYEEFGSECVHWLRGMFAFALYDVKRGLLFIARDRIGEKPLYLWQGTERVIFSSEMKSLVKAVPEELKLDRAAIDMFLHYQYVPEPATPFANIRKLAPGHCMLIRPKPWKLLVNKYWNLENAPPVKGEPAELIRQELDTITTLTLRSDVPVGISLSAGIDSNAIAAMAAPKYEGRMHVFTVGYEGKHDCDERLVAREVAQRLNLPFHDIEIRVDDFVKSLPELISACDDPIADIAAFGYYSVMKEARENDIPVILTGFGGDELFWGYPWVTDAVVRNVTAFGREFTASDTQFAFFDLHPDFKTFDQIAPSLYTEEFRRAVGVKNSFKQFTVSGRVDSVPVKVCKLLFDNWLVPNCIALGDRISMAASVELRLPLLDYKLVELAMGLHKTHPDSYRLGPKYWFKEALKAVLPEYILNRPKSGFTPPTAHWMHAAIKKYGHLLENGFLVRNNIIDENKLRQFFGNGLLAGPVCHIAFKLLTLELWCRAMLDIAQPENQSQQIASVVAQKALKIAQTVPSAIYADVPQYASAAHTGSSGSGPVGLLRNTFSPTLSVRQADLLSPMWQKVLENEPLEVARAKEVVRNYYQGRLREIWMTAEPPVWFDHNIDFYLWPRNIFWIENGVFGRLFMTPGCRVLDLCCGDGYYGDIWYSSIAGSIDACDIDEESLCFAKAKHANQKTKYYKVNLLTDSFPSTQYDVITWFSAIEHFSEPQIRAILNKIKVSMAQNGTLVGSTPLFERTGGHNHQHQREFTDRADLEEVLGRVFKHVKTWVSRHPERTICYFQCAQTSSKLAPFADIPVEEPVSTGRDFVKTAYEQVWSNKLSNAEWLKADGKGRVEYTADYLARKPLPQSDRILDIGCGRGTLGIFAKSKCEFYGIDISDAAVKEAVKVYKAAHVCNVSCEKLPFVDAYFDKAIMLDVIEHVFDPTFALRELFRVLKPGGELILCTPNILNESYIKTLVDTRKFPKTSGDAFPYDGGHIHFFTYRDCADLMAETGFTGIIPIGPYKHLENYEFKEAAVWLSATKRS